MKYNDSYSDELIKKMGKIKKKNRVLYDVALKKINEILEHPETYKSLRYDLKGSRRVHLLKSFVLIFRIDEASKIVQFDDIDHHDNIYKR